MRILFFLLFTSLGVSLASAANEPVMCTMDYTPVCGTVAVECVTAPCEPVRQTFGNSCMANASNASDITAGECQPIVELSSQDYVTWAYENALTRYSSLTQFGYDRPLTRQEAAAILSRSAEKVWGLRYASYPDICNIAYSDEASFDPTLQSDIYAACAHGLMYGLDKVFSPLRTLSRSEAIATIMRGIDGGKKDETGTIWFAPYAQRAQSAGILSTLDMSGFEQAITRGELIEWIYRASASMKTKTALIGNWKLDSYRLGDMVYTKDASLTLTDTSYSAKFCNVTAAAYSLEGDIFTAKNEVRTEMACIDNHLMLMENGWSLDGATYTITDNTLVITAAGGGIYTFQKEIPETELLMGDWVLQEYNAELITSTGYTLSLGADTINAKFCNNMFGSYTVKDGRIVAPTLASTRMYCEGLSMTLENTFAVDSATYSVVAVRRAAGSVGPTMYLTITTVKGDIFVFGR